MQKLKILNTREVKKIKDKLKEQFGFDDKLNYAFLLNEKGKLYIVNRDISKIELSKLKVDKYGMYFGVLGGGASGTRGSSFHRELREELRLSMEGAWLIGKKAKKGIVELDDKEVKKYFLGEDLDKDLSSEKKWILLKYGGDVISCAKYKDKKILNFLPKIHRSKELMV